MIISGENILKLLKGYLTYKKTPDGLIPFRFTERQLAEYKKDETYQIRSLASAGIRLVFQTDAAVLKLSCRVFKASSQDLYGFDLTEDGRLTGHAEGKLPDIENKVLEIAFPLSRESSRKELFLPCLAGTEILSLELVDACIADPVEDKPCILCLGDSITQGYIAHFPSYTYTSRLADILQMDLLNQGIGGDTFRPETLDSSLRDLPALIMIAYGTNDWSKNEDPEISARAFFREAMKIWPGNKVCILTPIWRKDLLTKVTPHGIPFEEWRKRLAEIVAEWPGATVIHGQELFPEIPELFHDGYLHPNDFGFHLFSGRLADRISAIGLPAHTSRS